LADGFNELPKTREDLGYKWEPIDIGVALANLLEYLKRNNARAFKVDVYASNNQVYRSIIIQLPYQSETFGAEDIHIGFNRDHGRQLELTRT
jgi:hypothetical protein